MEYKVIVHVMTSYSTIVEAESEEEAIKEALDREAPDYLMWYEENRVNQWEPEPLDEFPNLGKDEIPYVEEI